MMVVPVVVIVMMMSVRLFIVMHVAMLLTAFLTLALKLKRYVSDSVLLQLLTDFVLYLVRIP